MSTAWFRLDNPRKQVGFQILLVGCMVIVYLSCFALSAMARQSKAGEHFNTSSVKDEEAAPGVNSYCGIYSLYRALQALGIEGTFSDLVKPEYISSDKGSSIDDLTRAAANYGVQVEPLHGMTCDMLRSATRPIILHVKISHGIKAYNHWLLFMGTQDNKARILDRSQPLRLINYSDLAARWDGIGLVISREGGQIQWLQTVALFRLFLYASIAIATVATLRSLQTRLQRMHNGSPRRIYLWASVHQSLILAAIVILSATAYAVIQADGYLSSRTAIRAIQKAQLGRFLKKLEIEEVDRIRNSDSVTLIDARYPADYKEGHLSGAINLPPNMNKEEIKIVMSGIPETNRLVIYCQSRACPFSEIAARNLTDLGYIDLSLFPAGWAGWQELVLRSKN